MIEQRQWFLAIWTMGSITTRNFHFKNESSAPTTYANKKPKQGNNKWEGWS